MAMGEGDLSKLTGVVLILDQLLYGNLLNLQAEDMHLDHMKVDVGILE